MANLRSVLSAANGIPGAHRRRMPAAIHPMLATLADEPFTDRDWLYEIKWDGYRAVAFCDKRGARLVSRNQNDLTHQFPELTNLGAQLGAKRAVLDGEVCALDKRGRSSFSLLQQRTSGRSLQSQSAVIPLVYYAFDLLYLDGYDLRQVDLETRKKLLRGVLSVSEGCRLSESFPDGVALYEAARLQALEGIVAKRRDSYYVEKRSRDWLKIKSIRRQECVIGGYTDPRGSRQHFGSLVLGLYDDMGGLAPVGQAGTGFTASTQEEIWRRLQKIKTSRSPFHGKVDTNRGVQWTKPELVAEIKFTEWTHKGESGEVRMRAPVFLGLRHDKSPRECRFEKAGNPRVA